MFPFYYEDSPFYTIKDMGSQVVFSSHRREESLVIPARHRMEFLNQHTDIVENTGKSAGYNQELASLFRQWEYMEDCQGYFAPLDEIAEAIRNREGICGLSNDELTRLVQSDEKMQKKLAKYL